MTSSLTAVLVLAGSLAAGTAAMAATPATVRHAQPHAAAKATPVTVMSEKTDPDPGLAGTLMASDGALYTPVTKDPRIHGLPQY